MLNFTNIFIVLTGIFMSFYLFEQGEKYNLDSTAEGQIIRRCKLLKEKVVAENYENCLSRNSGIAYWQVFERMETRKALLIVPCVIFLTALFVGFAAGKKEILLTMISAAPLLMGLGDYKPDFIKVTMPPFYAVFTFISAWAIYRFKQYFFFKPH
jgi:hypothetical protein